jgi:hypothetical protein
MTERRLMGEGYNRMYVFEEIVHKILQNFKGADGFGELFFLFIQNCMR